MAVEVVALESYEGRRSRWLLPIEIEVKVEGDGMGIDMGIVQ